LLISHSRDALLKSWRLGNPLHPEEPVRRAACGLGDLIQSHSSYLSNRPGCFGDIRGLTAFSAMGNRGEVGAVGLDHERAVGRVAHGLLRKGVAEQILTKAG